MSVVSAPHTFQQHPAARTNRRPATGTRARWANVLLAPSRRTFERVALLGVITSAAIIPTGAAVRLSQSGLGCTDWPACTAHSLVASGVTGDPLVHRWVEFGNRLLTIALLVVAVLVFVTAWRYRDQHTGRHRRDLVWLASAQPLGIVAQAVIGGVVVLTKLDPFWVSLHYLATLPVIAAALALRVRCAQSVEPARPLVQPLVKVVVRALLAVTTTMMAVGTLVTGTGPLAGAGDVPRYHFLTLDQITQMHADVGWILGTLAVMTVLIAHFVPTPARVIRLAWLATGLIGAQGVIGYIQYFAHLPAGLVWLHVANTALIWLTVLWLNFAITTRGPAPDPVPEPAAAI